jgi:predicted DNA-binding protein (MmcQ/YjbR family)
MPNTGKNRGRVENDRLEKLSAICLALPQAVRENQLSHANFRVAKRVFAYYLNNHHDDGIVCVCCKAMPGDNERLIAASPQKFIMPAYIGHRGWVGLRLDRPTVDWAEVKELVRGSYEQTAPKRLLNLLEEI